MGRERNFRDYEDNGDVLYSRLSLPDSLCGL